MRFSARPRRSYRNDCPILAAQMGADHRSEVLRQLSPYLAPICRLAGQSDRRVKSGPKASLRWPRFLASHRFAPRARTELRGHRDSAQPRKAHLFSPTSDPQHELYSGCPAVARTYRTASDSGAHLACRSRRRPCGALGHLADECLRAGSRRLSWWASGGLVSAASRGIRSW
jgi:hypothetical protein